MYKADSERATLLLSNYDLGEGEIDFPALTRILKRCHYKRWICVNHHYTRVSPRYNFGPLHELYPANLSANYSQ